MQTVLASTYNAGYRIGMIVAGAGALFSSSLFRYSERQLYLPAWKTTYLAMATVMLVGILTTLIIREPQVNRVYKEYQRSDYYRLVMVFFVAVISFVLSYIYSGTLIETLVTSLAIKDSFSTVLF